MNSSWRRSQNFIKRYHREVERRNSRNGFGGEAFILSGVSLSQIQKSIYERRLKILRILIRSIISLAKKNRRFGLNRV